ncbi:neuroligin-4, X-linked [Procambarus clarkii]|uniref:neuroligin-4, X-linked n=1 Tax=Procambarus clarkii TaxID=6728 RepID=UPI001E6710FF|nr:neuroligin-4, X-linked-like [Procambarus clarkii]
MSLAWVVWAVVVSAVVSGGQPDQVLSRLVSTKYGKIQGFIRHHARHQLQPVEVFLGVPYASPPMGDGRFTPTSSPLPWDGVKRCTELPPVCPQSLVNTEDGELPPGRASQLASFRLLLQHQSEDCLYLNIYSPHDGGGRYPVMVYIHGENFSWGSGNLYDGSVLAAYGQVTVVTLNYRLGPLGFLNTSPNGSGRGVVGNQGLMDQLAALSWVNENIVHFGGDPTRVTLFGHSSGAACINYLIVSPVVVPGLFHRAVLMSGSALSPWAEVQDALSVTARLAKHLNCSLPTNLSDRHPETMACLRNVSAQRLATVSLPEYKFTSMFGPSVDGVVVPEDFKTRLSRVLEGRQMSVLFGVTEADGYPELNSKQATDGLDVQERNRLLRTYVRNIYHHHLQEIYLAITKEYTDWGNPAQHPVQVRDLTVEALSDGGYLAPLAKFGETISGRADAYMYVFNHHEKDRQRLGSVFGSEVPLVFGAPFMDSPGHWTTNFTRPDALVSELIMRYWTNFAKSGDPNLPEEVKPVLSYKERERTKQRNITWEPYEAIYEKYLEISYRPRLKDHYRAHKVALWNWLIPELEEAGSKYPDSDAEAWHASEDPKHFIGPVRPLDPFRFLHTTHVTSTSAAPALPTPSDEYLPPNVSAAHGSVTRPVNVSSEVAPTGQLLDYTTALTLTVAIGLSLLVLNAILFAALIYKRDRNAMGPKIKYDSASAQPLCTVDSGMRSVSTHEALSSPVKDNKSACNVDLQCTELHTFPTPPDIGDRNTEVTFHTSNSMHSLLSQPTSQFIPPPPLLATTPPTPPVAGQHGEGGLESGACGGPRCYSDVSNGQYADVGGGQYPPDVGQYPSEIKSGHYPEINLEQYRSSGGGQCVEPSIAVYPATSSSSCPSYQPQHAQYCSHYSASVSQYSSSTDQYSISGSQFSSPGAPCGTSTCQFSEPGVQCLPQSSYSDDGQDLMAPRTIRSATLQRGSSSSSSSSSRKPQPPPRGSTLPSYATLPRHSSKDSLSHINA